MVVSVPQIGPSCWQIQILSYPNHQIKDFRSFLEGVCDISRLKETLYHRIGFTSIGNQACYLAIVTQTGTATIKKKQDQGSLVSSPCHTEERSSRERSECRQIHTLSGR